MADQSTNYQCPACTGPLHFVGSSGKLECDYCGSSFSVEEVEKLYAEKNDAAAANAGKDGGWGEGSEGMKTYSCPSCGAEMITDGNTAATCCPYCGNQTVMPGQFEGALKPEYIIPFKNDKKAAIDALKAHYKGKFLLPKSFVSGNHIDDIQGVYVPFWLFDGKAEGSMKFDARKVHTSKHGDMETTTTEYYEADREGSLEFEKIPVDASTRMPDEHMDSIEPYDYSELKPFSMAYMPGFLADKYDVEVKDCRNRMEERSKMSLEAAIDNTVTGYSSKSVMTKDLNVEVDKAHYALMPVWLLATKWRDQSFLFAMNGQSGKLIGDLPMDKGKFGGVFAVVSLVLIILMNLIFSRSMEGFGYFFVCFLLPLIIAGIVCMVLRSQLKSVHTGNADAYISGGGLKLSRSDDVYIRTEKQTRKVNKN